MILGLHDIKKGKKRFHFESFWPKLDGFQEAVSSAWASVPFGSCPLLSLSVKLKATSRGLQRWSDKRVGHVASQLELARELLHQLKIAQDGRGLSSEESWLRNNLKKHCLALSSLSCTIARLRSRIGWIKEGMPTQLYSMHMQDTGRIKTSLQRWKPMMVGFLQHMMIRLLNLMSFTNPCLALIWTGTLLLILTPWGSLRMTWQHLMPPSRKRRCGDDQALAV
jgi:hypothetical protein